jgi:amino acid efflux transporter
VLGVWRGAALYVGALIGPGLLFVPSLAVRAAGPASIVGWISLLVLSAPLAVTFAMLGVRHPVAGGVSAYAREAFGESASAAVGACFLTAVVIGGPPVALIGGYYVVDLTPFGTKLALAVAFGMYATVLLANVLGLRVSSSFQLGLSAALVIVVVVAVAAVLPAHASHNWAPFAPHGWWAIGTAANLLFWLFLGWEAVAQLAGDFRDPARDLPRAVALSFAVITVIYAGLAVATIALDNGKASRVPLADLLAVGFGPGGRDLTAVLALVITMGTMNVYIGASAKLAAALASERALPAWLSGDAHRSVPRRPLLALAISAAFLLAALSTGVATSSDLVRATSACFIVVYVIALAAATRMLKGWPRAAACLTLTLMCLVGAFSFVFMVVPALAAAAAIGFRRFGRARI